MSKRFLIAEWMGRWAIPDDAHGGVRPGPHASFEEAKAVLSEYVEKQSRSWEEHAGPTEAERERKILRRRLQIVEVEWPEVDPDILCGYCGSKDEPIDGSRGWPECSECGGV